MKFNIASLDGKWHVIIEDLTNFTVTNKPNKPCPFCGGDDRFSYTNLHGNGTWLCRKCTPQGSDGIGFIAKKLNRDRIEVFKKIVSIYSYSEIKEKKIDKDLAKAKFIKTENPIDNWSGIKILNKNKKYKFNYIWKWYKPDGSFFGYVTRLEFNDTKIVWQIHHGRFDDEVIEGWQQVSVKDKPLFGYPKNLKDKNYKAVIIVEGEKTCIAAKKFIGDDYLILCTQGGSNQVHNTNWDWLKASQYQVYIWPDLDTAGIEYAKKIQEVITRAKLFDIEKIKKLGLTESQDIADLKNLTKETITELINNDK